MKNIYFIIVCLTSRLNFLASKSCRQSFVLFALLLSLISISQVEAQNTIPTKGKDFWVGFPFNAIVSSTKKCQVFITSTVNTSGIVTIPQQGFSLNFTVVANQTTTLTLPTTQVEHLGSEIIDNKGINIISLDTVSVFAIAYQDYSADATVIYPKQSLGTEYRIGSYKGISDAGFQDLCSDFLIVATEDGTQFNITTTAATKNGRLAGVPFQVTLNAGQSYQVLAANSFVDFTGTLIKATDSSGSCRPFAVYSGAVCTRVPSTCYACDVLYEQNLPVTSWGKTYYSVPYSFANGYTLRIMAHTNTTFYSINGGPSLQLNAGQFAELNGVLTPQCITATSPISVIQYMEGITCAGAGDPSMMFLNADEQKIDNVTFSTVTSTIINQHYVNVIMNTSQVSQLKLDGIPVLPSKFTPFPNCNSTSYAQLSLTQGSHTLDAPGGFTAYVYGTGSAESYAYSVGSFSKSAPINIDSVTCSTDTVVLGGSNQLFGSWWSTATLPNDTIGLGPNLTLLPPISPNIYILNGNEFISGCSKKMYFDVDVPTPPIPFVNIAADTVCKFQTVQLNAGTVPLSANSLYTWTPTTGLNNPNISNPVLTADSSRWYKVAISSPNSCAPTVYDSVYIYVKLFSLPNAFAGSNQTICKGDSATLTAASGYTYQWLPGGSLDSTITVSPIVSTDYIVFITDTNGCGNSDTVRVLVNQNPIINAGVDRTICAGTFIILTATGGSSYLWNTGVATNNLSVSPSSSLTYSVIGTSSNGCTSTDSVFVNVNPLPPASAGIDQSICKGGSATLTATGGLTYLWTPTSSTSSSITVTPFANSNYVVLVTDSLGCQKRDTVRVIVLQLPFANAGLDQTICIGSTATLAATGGSTYQWTPGNLIGDSINVNPVSTTGYQVTVTDSLGCQKIDSVKVFVNALPALELGSNVSICDGDTLTINSPVIAVNYLWMPGNISSSTFTISPTDTSQIVLMITDVNGCQNLDSIQVLVNPLPLANAGNDVKICSGFPTTLQGTGGVGYLWTPGNVVTPANTVAPTSSTVYFLTVTDNNGCIASDSVNVFVDPYISGASFEDTICIGNSIILSDTGGVSYLWSYNNSTNDTIIVSPVTSTSYYVNIVTPVGCLIYDTMNVYVNQLPLANAGAAKTICIGDSTTLQATGGLLYNWNVPNGNASLVTVQPISTSSFIVEVTDVNGCKNSDTVIVAVNALPIANAGLDQTICAGDSTTLVASGGVNYSWNVSGSSGPTVVVAPINSDKFIVLVEDANGCFDKDTVEVFVNNLPVASYTINPNNCEDTPILFTNTSYSVSSSIVINIWDFGDGNNSNQLNPSNTFIEAMDYNVELTVTDLLGCENKISNQVTINYLPLPDFVATNACVNEEISFKDLSIVNAGKITNWLWDFGDGRSSLLINPIHEYLQHGVYDVALKVTTDSSCATTMKKVQYVEIYPLPEADFNATPSITSILDPKVQYIDVSKGGSIWSWDFGDLKGFSSNQNPFYFYNDTGYFNVSLILENTYGCLDTAYREIYIAPGFTIYIPSAFTPNGDEKNDYFIPSGMGIASLDMRIFDRYGAEIFSTSDLNAPWNGSVRNTEQLCSVGVYAYYMKIRDYKGLVTEYSGVVSLVR